MLIVFEGIDGSGKETQIRMCLDFLEKKGGTATHKYPTGNFRELHKYLEGKSELDPQSQFLLFLVDISMEQKDIVSELMHGKTVILDRYVFSTIAYQGGHVGIEKSQSAISGMDFLKPDLAILLDLPAQKAIERKRKQKALDRFESDPVFLEQVRSRYLKLASENYLCEWAVVNADRDESAIHSDIAARLEQCSKRQKPV